MNLITTAAVQTMTSREIADLTGKRHPDVKRDIEKMFADLKEDVSKSARIYMDSMNREQTEYALDRELTETLLTGYSTPLRRKVIQRWRELEAGASPQLPQTFAQALRLAAEQAELIEQQQAQLTAAAPKVEFVDRYVDSSSGAKGFREVCKLLKAKEPAFREFLAEKKIMYRLHGALTPYAEHLDAGRFEIKTGTSEANGHAYNAARFTPKGIAWVAGLWAAHQLQQEAA